VQCDPGYYCKKPDNGISASSVDFDKFTKLSGYYTTRTPCSAGDKCSAGRTDHSGGSDANKATIAIAGTFTHQGFADEVDCSFGTYASGTKNKICTEAAAGKLVATTKATAEVSCPAGTYCAGTGNTAAKKCDIGFKNTVTTGAAACTACPPN